MDKLNLPKRETYKLEVNDNGDYIEFDLTDLNLPFKVQKASNNMRKIIKEYNSKIRNINQTIKNEKQLSLAVIKATTDKNSKLEKEFDSFLGEGSCKKIFGDKNYYGMYEELLEALEPHFKAMKINIKRAQEKLIEKYMPKNKEVI